MLTQKIWLWVWQIVIKTNSNHMALFKYFKKEERFLLPDPLGLLQTKVPSSAIQAANKGVKQALDVMNWPNVAVVASMNQVCVGNRGNEGYTQTGATVP